MLQIRRTHVPHAHRLTGLNFFIILNKGNHLTIALNFQIIALSLRAKRIQLSLFHKIQELKMQYLKNSENAFNPLGTFDDLHSAIHLSCLNYR